MHMSKYIPSKCDTVYLLAWKTYPEKCSLPQGWCTGNALSALPLLGVWKEYELILF